MPRHSTKIDPELAESIRKAGAAEAMIDEKDKPDFVMVEGVKYYRAKPVISTDPAKPQGIKDGHTRIVINVAPHAANIRIDNRIYYANMEYDVRDDQVPTFMEIMQRTWEHERATGGANSNMPGARNTTFNLRTQHAVSRLGPPGISG